VPCSAAPADEDVAHSLGHGSTCVDAAARLGQALLHAMHVDVPVAREHVEEHLAANAGCRRPHRRRLRRRVLDTSPVARQPRLHLFEVRRIGPSRHATTG
jgi:hypothetical protein